MAALVTWADYLEYLGGREPPIPESDFPNVARKTMRRINQHTTAGSIPEDIFTAYKDLIVDVFCELAELIYVQEEQAGLSSVGVTGHSMAFEKDNKDASRILAQLWPTGLLYRGGG